MSKNWNIYFKEDINNRKQKSLYRSLKEIEYTSGREIIINGKTLLNFASNDYLGLTNDKRIIENGYTLSKKWGAGSGASRLISGTLSPFCKLEDQFANWIGKEKVLIFNSGYQANIGILSALANRDTVVFSDKLNHASIYDGIVLSRCIIARFAHRNISSLENLLKKNKNISKKIIIIDSVFSMEGDISPLVDIVRLAKKYDALTVVDEAHSIGLFGEYGQGLAAKHELIDEIDIIMGTLGKSFGVFGAFVAAKNNIIEYLINKCRPFIFTTALPPFIIGAVTRALEIIKNEKRGQYTLDLADKFRRLLEENNINFGNSCSQIIPVITGSNDRAISLMSYVLENGFFAPAIRPPTVPVNTSRVRFSVSYNHNLDDIKRVVCVIKDWYEKRKDND